MIRERSNLSYLTYQPLAVSSSTMNLDVNDAANDNPDHILKDGEQVQVPTEEVTVKKRGR